jgi:hypothetical protein
MIDTRKPPQRGSFDYLLGPLAISPEADILPPPKPPEPPRRQRIRIQIEIGPQTAQEPRGRLSFTGRVLLAILFLSLLGALLGCAQAQSVTTRQNPFDRGYSFEGVGTDGKPFSGRNYANPFDRGSHTVITTQDGKTRECETRVAPFSGDRTIECGP